MKKTLFILLVLVISCHVTKAQLRYYNQWTTGISAGPTFKKGFFLSAGIEKYLNRGAGSIAVNLNYTRNSKFFLIREFHISTISFSTSYFYSLETVIRPPFFINIGGGLFAGAETFEKERNLPEGIIQNPGTYFTYGISFKPQAEYLISKKASLYIQPQIDYYIKSRFSNFLFIPTFGLKVYFQ